MGMIMGKIKQVYRPVKNYNLEERAFKAISKDKPTPAPTYDKMKEIMAEIKRDPELLTRDRIEPKTLDHLTKVFIQSQGDNATIQRKKDFLPVERSSTLDYEYGFEEPKNIPLGKVSMKQLLDLINNHEVKPHEFSPEVLAEHYKLNVDDVRNIVKYYKPFQVHVPKKQPKKEGPKGLKLIQHKIDQLKE